MPKYSDEDIAKHVQDGDADAFGELIQRYEAKLLRYARRFLLDAQDAEDMVQTVFIKAYMNIQSFKIDKRFSPWIYRIAHNTFINHLNKKKRDPFLWLDSDTFFPSVRAKGTPESELQDEELKELVHTHVQTLDPKYREPLVLYFFEELSYKDIAEVLKIPVATVGVRIKRAKDKLKNIVQKET